MNNVRLCENCNKPLGKVFHSWRCILFYWRKGYKTTEK